MTCKTTKSLARRLVALLHGALACAALAACAGAIQPAGDVEKTQVESPNSTENAPDLAATYAKLRQEGGRSFRLNPAQSQVRIYAFRAGKASRFGHNHVLSAPQFQGYFYLAPDGMAASRFDLVFRLDELVLDDPQHRAVLGQAFASKLSDEDTVGTRNNMLGETYFQAGRYPWVRIHSREISGEAPKFAATIAMELHGQTREIRVPLTVQGLPEQLRVEGAFVLRQTDFGVKPLSVLGGLLSVQDAVIVEFTLTGDAP